MSYSVRPHFSRPWAGGGGQLSLQLFFVGGSGLQASLQACMAGKGQPGELIVLPRVPSSPGSLPSTLQSFSVWGAINIQWNVTLSVWGVLLKLYIRAVITTIEHSITTASSLVLLPVTPSLRTHARASPGLFSVITDLVLVVTPLRSPQPWRWAGLTDLTFNSNACWCESF